MTYKHFLSAAAAALVFTACQKDLKQNDINREPDAAKKGGIAGAVYVLGNESTNKVLAYDRTAGGTLSFSAAYETGGMGSGGGLGSQGAITLSADYNWLIAVNAGSNSISSFKVTGQGLSWVDDIPSNGVKPISVTIHDGLVYVLNAGDMTSDANISGFHIDADGMLHEVMNSTKPLSAPLPGPAQVSFVNDGAALAITEKGTNKIVTYTLVNNIPDMMHMMTSAHPTPFGFGVGKNGLIYVSEADGGNPMTSAVSSYAIGWNGSISLVDGPETAHQTAACWVVVSNNGKYVYATNTGSNTLSTFSADSWGNLGVLYGDVPAGSGSTPIDAAMSNNAHYLYVLNAGSHTIEGFSVGSDGYPSYTQTISGLPASAVGMAAK